MKRLEKMFENSDGHISWTAVGVFISIIWFFVVHITIYALLFIHGVEISEGALNWSLASTAQLISALIVRGVQGFSKYWGTDFISSVGSNGSVRGKIEKKTDVKIETTAKIADIQPKFNFNIDEFASADGTKMNASVKANILLLMQYMEVIREACGNKPINITSGYRSAKHNASVGGAKNSMHVKGMAADFQVKGMKPSQVVAVVEQLINKGKIPAGGVGSYARWTHYDFRGINVRWKG